jgi:hypothetical protein
MAHVTTAGKEARPPFREIETNDRTEASTIKMDTIEKGLRPMGDESPLTANEASHTTRAKPATMSPGLFLVIPSSIPKARRGSAADVRSMKLAIRT